MTAMRTGLDHLRNHYRPRYCLSNERLPQMALKPQPGQNVVDFIDDYFKDPGFASNDLGYPVPLHSSTPNISETSNASKQSSLEGSVEENDHPEERQPYFRKVTRSKVAVSNQDSLPRIYKRQTQRRQSSNKRTNIDTVSEVSKSAVKNLSARQSLGFREVVKSTRQTNKLNILPIQPCAGSLEEIPTKGQLGAAWDQVALFDFGSVDKSNKKKVVQQNTKRPSKIPSDCDYEENEEAVSGSPILFNVEEERPIVPSEDKSTRSCKKYPMENSVMEESTPTVKLFVKKRLDFDAQEIPFGKADVVKSGKYKGNKERRTSSVNLMKVPKNLELLSEEKVSKSFSPMLHLERAGKIQNRLNVTDPESPSTTTKGDGEKMEKAEEKLIQKKPFTAVTKTQDSESQNLSEGISKKPFSTLLHALRSRSSVNRCLEESDFLPPEPPQNNFEDEFLIEEAYSSDFKSWFTIPRKNKQLETQKRTKNKVKLQPAECGMSCAAQRKNSKLQREAATKESPMKQSKNQQMCKRMQEEFRIEPVENKSSSATVGLKPARNAGLQRKNTFTAENVVLAIACEQNCYKSKLRAKVKMSPVEPIKTQQTERESKELHCERVSSKRSSNSLRKRACTQVRPLSEQRQGKKRRKKMWIQ
ncbi:centromere protein C isoform X1 [Rhinatrema bivittatum]|uniref:centromere protein C isoform X1 n=1 Tax=Rhinatrema bivittatum TaxID=194408 RepID=UPI001129B19F|nr:centromere protein C isoform X1 [Rhinatrema bivittatum]XP_029456684.1 centromere protein C isoform X1 [Rhinatrema bivittatum]